MPLVAHHQIEVVFVSTLDSWAVNRVKLESDNFEERVGQQTVHRKTTISAKRHALRFQKLDPLYEEQLLKYVDIVWQKFAKHFWIMPKVGSSKPFRDCQRGVCPCGGNISGSRDYKVVHRIDCISCVLGILLVTALFRFTVHVGLRIGTACLAARLSAFKSQRRFHVGK